MTIWNNEKLRLGISQVFLKKMIKFNLKLQRNKVNFIKAKEIISSFIVKFDLYKTNINRQELSQFSNHVEVMFRRKWFDSWK